MSNQRPVKLNKFNRAKIVRVSALPATMLAAVVINGGLFLLLVASLYFTWSYGLPAVEARVSRLTPLPSPVVSPTPLVVSPVEGLPSPTAMATTFSFTPTPAPTWTPIPTWTPAPTWTAVPTWTPSPTPTATPTATPRLYTADYLQSRVSSGGDVKDYVQVESDYAFGFYRAICHDVPGQRFIQPRVISSLDLESTGYYWRLDNEFSGYDYISELPHNSQTTFYLSEDASLFSVRLYWYDDQISDRVALDFPESCKAAQLIFVEASPRSFDVEVSGVGIVSGSTGQVITSTLVITQ